MYCRYFLPIYGHILILLVLFFREQKFLIFMILILPIFIVFYFVFKKILPTQVCKDHFLYKMYFYIIAFMFRFIIY